MFYFCHAALFTIILRRSDDTEAEADVDDVEEDEYSLVGDKTVVGRYSSL